MILRLASLLLRIFEENHEEDADDVADLLEIVEHIGRWHRLREFGGVHRLDGIADEKKCNRDSNSHTDAREIAEKNKKRDLNDDDQ